MSSIPDQMGGGDKKDKKNKRGDVDWEKIDANNPNNNF